MHIKDYEQYLSRLETPEQWRSVPLEDFLLFGCFGSLTPEILRGPHRFLRSDSSAFASLVACLGLKPGRLRHIPPSVESSPPDHGLTSRVEQVFLEWQQATNQEHLLKDVSNLKYESSFDLLCDARVSPGILSRAVKQAEIRNTTPDCEWFEGLRALLSEGAWFYVPLNEISRFDLFVFGDDLEESVFECLRDVEGWAIVGWEGGRAHWPEDVA